MKRLFARNSNVVDFLGAMDRLRNREEGVPGMALLYGEPGLGKTKTAIWWALDNDGIFVRTKRLMTGNWMLSEIVAELGEAPMRTTAQLFRQAESQLLERPRTVFIDEADVLDVKLIETLRDVHDMTAAPMVFIGMGMADKKLRRYEHLFDRFSEIIKFHPLTREDVRSIAEQLCETTLTSDAINYIHAQDKRFRRVIVWFYRAEKIARAGGLKEVSAADLVGEAR